MPKGNLVTPQNHKVALEEAVVLSCRMAAAQSDCTTMPKAEQVKFQVEWGQEVRPFFKHR